MEGATNELQQILSQLPPNYIQPAGTQPNAISTLHASLEYLRHTGDERFLFLRTLLEVLTGHGYFASTPNGAPTPLSTDDEQLLFHCITGLRHVLLTRWNIYCPSLRSCMRDFLFMIGLCHLRQSDTLSYSSNANHQLDGFLPKVLSMSCLNGAAALWKRGWVTEWNSTSSLSMENDDNQVYVETLLTNVTSPNMTRFSKGDQGKQELFIYLNSILLSPFNNNGQFHHQRQDLQYTSAMAASFLSFLLGEFTGGQQSSKYNLPLEFHHFCHVVFESGHDGQTGSSSGLDATLELSMSCLSSIVACILTDSNPSNAVFDRNNSFFQMGSSVINLTLEVLSWEFRENCDFSNWITNTKNKNIGVLLRPPHKWRKFFINPDFLGAIISVYSAVRVNIGADGRMNASMSSLHLTENRSTMAHQLRQLLLQLASIADGPIFASGTERVAYAGFILDGCLRALDSIMTVLRVQYQQNQMEPFMNELLGLEIVDFLTIFSRLATNFRIKAISRLPTFPHFLSALNTIGQWILETSLSEFIQAKGNIEYLEDSNWKNDAMTQILQCSDAMADDFWLVSDAGSAEVIEATQALAKLLAPLYEPYCRYRLQISSLEERYLSEQEVELDDMREEISADELEEEMVSVSSLGRLNVMSSITALSDMLQKCTLRLMTLFESMEKGSTMTPDVSALMEEARMLILYVCYLLTDNSSGETLTVPEAVCIACKNKDGSENFACISSITSVVDSLMSVSEAQAKRVSQYPSEPTCSPLLAKTLLCFFRRWITAYIFPTSDGYEHNGGIHGIWSTAGQAQSIVSFCTALCLVYFCHWPLEKDVQDEATSLLFALAKKGPVIRQLLVTSSSFQQIAALHTVCVSLRHNATSSDIATASEGIGKGLSPELVRGYQRLPYSDRARILTCLLVGCCNHEEAKNIIDCCLNAVQKSFSRLLQTLINHKSQAQSINMQESLSLCIQLHGGIVLASDMADPDLIPLFITPALPYLSGLMKFDSLVENLTICEDLLKLFRDYAEQFLAKLNHDQCSTLFMSSASLLHSYSDHHCRNRVIQKISNSLDTDEQNYTDVLCTIQLLIHLGTKEFIDIWNSNSSSSHGFETDNIADTIFFGLQQILPLMTQGLLQFPTLCMQYFSLVGFMVETYPNKLCQLPFNLFMSLLDSLKFAMCHSDSLIAKSALQALASLAKEHLSNHSLTPHLTAKNDIIDNCAQFLLEEVIFQSIIWDRLEAAGMALLPLASIDFQKFSTLVNSMSQRMAYGNRLQVAFGRLMKPEVMAGVALNSKEGRMIRLQFKSDFEIFVRDVQSFLIMR